MSIYFFLLHWLFAITIISLSWYRYKNVLHPHFIFTSFIVIFLSDFLVRGYDDESFAGIQLNDIYIYQIYILSIFAIIVYLTAQIKSTELENLAKLPIEILINQKEGVRKAIFIMGVVILLLDLFKRFNSVNWSIEQVIYESMMARGQAVWDISTLVGGNFIFSLSTQLLPYSGMAMASLVYSRYSKIKVRLLPLFIFSFVVLLLVLNGARTPVVICLASLELFIIFNQKNLISKILSIIGFLIITTILTSVMVEYRSLGYEDIVSNDVEATYHQDDSYYRAIFAYHQAEISKQFWSPVEFFYTISVNFIPRSFWPNKPLFTQEFYGDYKLEWVTTTFIGEIVAMYGAIGSLIVAPIVAILLYIILYKSLKLLKYPLGLISYILMALYVYMSLRSMPNIMFFIYLPGFSVISSWLLFNFNKE